MAGEDIDNLFVSVILGPKKPLELDEISNIDELLGVSIPTPTLPEFNDNVFGLVDEEKLRVNVSKSTVLLLVKVPSPVYNVGGKLSYMVANIVFAVKPL